MLTIKHIGPDGTEIIVECDRFVRERRDDGNTQFTARLDGPPPPEGCVQPYSASWCGRQLLGGIALDMHTIYVMNRYGKTVETYRFSEPDFSLTQQRGGVIEASAMAQADPAFLNA